MGLLHENSLPVEAQHAQYQQLVDIGRLKDVEYADVHLAQFWQHP